MSGNAGDLDHLELRAVGLADALVTGVTSSLFRGEGVESDGLRPYVPGDDVRALDWRVTARTGRPHVRERTPEREMEVRVLVDRSASLRAGPSPWPEQATVESASLLSSAAFRLGLRCGMTLFSGEVVSEVPPGRGRSHLRRTLAVLDGTPPSGMGTALAPALEGVMARLRTRALVAIVSDFRLTPEARGQAALALARAARRHDLLPIRIRAPDVRGVGKVGRVRFTDPESGRRLVIDMSDDDVRRRLTLAEAEEDAWWRSLWGSLGVACVEVTPGEPVGIQLAAGLALRRRRRA
jgi:uncharacterized protein (DUF58 family)